MVETKGKMDVARDISEYDLDESRAFFQKMSGVMKLSHQLIRLDNVTSFAWGEILIDGNNHVITATYEIEKAQLEMKKDFHETGFDVMVDSYRLWIIIPEFITLICKSNILSEGSQSDQNKFAQICEFLKASDSYLGFETSKEQLFHFSRFIPPRELSNYTSADVREHVYANQGTAARTRVYQLHASIIMKYVDMCKSLDVNTSGDVQISCKITSLSAVSSLPDACSITVKILKEDKEYSFFNPAYWEDKEDYRTILISSSGSKAEGILFRFNCTKSKIRYVKDFLYACTHYRLYAESLMHGEKLPPKQTKPADRIRTSSGNMPQVEVCTDPISELNNLIGLKTIKKDVIALTSLVKIQRDRESKGFRSVPVSLHMVFTGNPGTGKTTVARILCQIYKNIGVLSKGQLVEVSRADLVAAYVGQTAIKTKERIKEAIGGILFIDEAYTLAKKGNDFGQEAIDTLLKEMEDHREDFIVIVAGYPELMDEFINSNPGLKSRFNKYFNFPDYSAEELVQIFFSLCAEYDYTLTEKATEKIKCLISTIERNKTEHFGNARDIRNIFEKTITNQAVRCASSVVENFNLIEEDDICSE